MNPPPDHVARATELVRLAKAGDDAAFGELVRRYRARIFALALHLTGSESDADDVTQEVFIGAHRALDKFAGRSQFFTWVYRMGVNRSLNARRDRKRRGETDLDDPRVHRAVSVDAAGDPVRAADLRETYGRLLAALDRMPAEMRTSVVLVTLQGLSHGEAAVVQSCQPGTIAWRIHVARKRLRRAFGTAARRPDRVRGGSSGISRDLDRLLREWGLPVLAPS